MNQEELTLRFLPIVVYFFWEAEYASALPWEPSMAVSKECLPTAEPGPTGIWGWAPWAVPSHPDCWIQGLGHLLGVHEPDPSNSQEPDVFYYYLLFSQSSGPEGQ